MPGVWHGDARHRCRTGRKWHRTSLPRARRTWAAADRSGATFTVRATSASQTVSQRTNQDLIRSAQSAWQPLFSAFSRLRRLEAPASGRAKTTSVIDTINRRASLGQLAGTYPYSSKQSNPAVLRATRLQLRCNPDRAGMCVHVFSIEFALSGADGDAPCVKYRFNSYTSRGLTAACRLYIQNEGLRENFWEDRTMKMQNDVVPPSSQAPP
jgi:hypothetical protein